MEWKSKGLFDESIKPPSTSDKSLSPLIDCLGNKIKLKLNGDWLKQNKLIFPHETIVNIYEFCASGSFNENPTLKNALFG